jgi:hypothetical protein
MKYLILLSIVLLAGCAKSSSQAEMHPSKTEMHLSREEIKVLCKSVGDKAFAEANDGTKSFSTMRRIEKGAAAECELKYLTGKSN